MSDSPTPVMIEERLRSALSATQVKVEDHSKRHRGHASAKDGAGHYRVTVVAEVFEGKNRVQSQRLVYDALSDLMADKIHALEMKLSAE